MAIPQPSSLAARREVRPLPLLKTSFDDTLLQVSSPRCAPASKSTTDLRPSSRKNSLQGTKSGSSSRAASPKKPPKSPVFSLFSKPKVERAKARHEQNPSKPRRQPPNFSRPGTSDGRSQPVSRSQPSQQQQFSELSKAASNDSSLTLTPMSNTPARNMGLSDAVRHLEPPKRSTPPPSPLSSSWAPPPLFQAYPQAVIHSSLEDPDHHTLKLTRAKRRVQNLSKSEEGLGAHLKRGSLSRPSTARKASVSSSIHPDAKDTSSSRKVYVLATSGYVLQYAGDGPSDRRPEKTLKLGPKSVAYASDAIPGKHWVIQVLQAASDDELNPFVSHKSFFNRLLPSRKKATVRSLLLVLDSPAEMNKWLHSIRREICKFGAKPSQIRPSSKRPPSAESRKSTMPHRVLAMTRSASPSNLSKPASPGKPLPSGPSIPTSPTTLESGYTSSGTTLVGSNENSSRSSRQPVHAKTTSDLQRNFHAPRSPTKQVRQGPGVYEYFSDDDNVVLRQPPNTAVPPLTPARDVDVELAESPDQTSPPSNRKGSVPHSESSSQMESPEQQFFTPATTPMQAFFPQNDGSKQPSPPRLRQHVNTSPKQKAVILKDHHRKSTIPSRKSSIQNAHLPDLRLSKSAPGLYSFNEPEVPDPAQSTYFTQRTPEGSTEDTSKGSPGALLGNAFAQAAVLNGKQSSLQAPSKPLPKRSSSLQPLQLLQTVGETTQIEKHHRTSIHSNSPLPLHTVASSSQRSSLKPLRESTMADFGLGIQRIPDSSPSDRDSALLQLGGLSSDLKLSTNSAQASPNIDSFPTPSNAIANDRALRRPPSITVNTDVAPFLATSRHPARIPVAGTVSAPVSTGGVNKPTPTSATRTPVSGTGAPSSAASLPNTSTGYPYSATSRPVSGVPISTRQRNSVLVPVVRPPTVRQSKGSRQMLRLGNPPTKPPEAPLPPPPPTAHATSVAG